MSGNESKQTGTEILLEEAEARRDFLKRAAAVGMAAPAVVLLLSGKPAHAWIVYNGGNETDKGDLGGF